MMHQVTEAQAHSHSLQLLLGELEEKSNDREDTYKLQAKDQEDLIIKLETKVAKVNFLA